MKKLFLCVLLAGMIAGIFAGTFVIGPGTSTSGLFPMYGSNDYSWSKQIYTAAEINAAGLNEATDISGFGLYVGNTPSNYVMLDQRIYVRHTNAGIYGTATDETGTGYPDNECFTQVFQGPLTFNGGGWHYFMFNNNFPWDNSRNIEILWENWDGSGLTGNPTFRNTAMGTNNYYNVYKNQNTTFPTTFGTRSLSRPNLTLITPSTDPPNPAILNFPPDNGWAFMEGTLSWSDGGGLPTSYDVLLGTEEPLSIAPGGDDLTTTSYTLPAPLEPDQPYLWRVIPRNGNGPNQDVPTWHFHTPAANQLAESFDSTALPNTWYNPGTWTRSTSTPFHGAATAYKSASTTPALYSTPLLAISATSTFDFYYRTSSTNGFGRMQIKYSPDRANWIPWEDVIVMPTTTTWNHATINLSGILGNYYLGFEVFTTTSTSGIYLDYVFGPPYAEVAPGPVTLSTPSEGAGAVSVYPTFTWTAPLTGGIPTGYTVYCDQNPIPVTPLATVNGLTYTATTALVYDRPYYWTVVAHNTTGFSSGNPIGTFTTMLDPTVYVPWSEDFGTTGAAFPPTNWSRWTGVIADPSVLTTSTLWVQDNWRNDTTVTPVDFSSRLNIYSTNRYGWLITPPISLPGTGYQLEFDLALTDYANSNPISSDPNGTTGVDDKFVVLIGNGGSWTPANIVMQWDNVSSPNVYNNIPHTGQHITLPLDAYTGSIFVAFYGESTVSNADNDLFVDNVRVRQTPVGLPDHVTLVSPLDVTNYHDPDNLVLTWNAALTGGTPDYYEVHVGADPIDPGMGYYGDIAWETNEPFFNLSDQDFDLGYDHTWYWAVLPYNAGDPPQCPDPNSPDFMVWEFTTAPDPTIRVLPHAEYFDAVTTPYLPWGWKKYLQYTTGTPNVTTSTTTPVSSPNNVYMTNSTDAAATVVLVTPPFAMPLGTIKARFYARSGTDGQTLLIGAMDANRTTFEQIGTVTLTTTNTQYSIELSSYGGAFPYIGFKHGLGATSRSIYIDNIEFIELVNNDLAAVSLAGSALAYENIPADWTITVKNEGLLAQDSYTVSLKRSSDNQVLAGPIQVNESLAAGSTAQHTFTWTPTAPFIGANQVYGEVVLAQDATPGNNQTINYTAYVVGTSTEVVGIGDPDTTTKANTLPVNFYYKNSVSESLYFYDETHLISGDITAVVLKNNFVQDLFQKPVKIWMGQNTLEDLTGGWVSADGLTPVFNGLVDFPMGVNEVVIPLPTSYPVAAGNNLLIRYNRPMDSVYFLTSNHFYYTATTYLSRSRYLAADTTTYDPLSPSEEGSTSANVPNTMLLVNNAVFAQEAILEGYVRDTLNQPIVGATVTLTERVATTTDETGFYQFRFWVADDYDATASKFAYYSQTITAITTIMGSTVTRNFVLTALPRVTVSGIINANDAPAGLEGAAVELSGVETYSTVTGAGGVFSIPNVLGHIDGLDYNLSVEKEGYQSHLSTRTIVSSNLDVGTITLIEYLYPAYNLVATHSGTDQSAVLLNWDEAGPPLYTICDFEADNGGWVGSGYGDWQWTNAYTLTGYVDGDSYADTPPTTAHSGTGLWGTKVLGSYSNAAAWSYLRQTFDLSMFTHPVLSFWHYMNGYNTWDYGIIKANGTTVWGSSTAAVFMPWQQLTVNLIEFAGLSSVEISFEWYATNTVNYAGWYIDDLYIGPAMGRTSGMHSSNNNNRVFLDYSIYRLKALDVANPAAWIHLTGNHSQTTYTDLGFGAQPADIYKWAVKANYSGGLQSDPVFSNNLGRVYPPDDIEVGHSGNNVNIGWEPQPGADFYKIYASHNPHGPFEYIGWTITPNYSTIASVARKFFVVVACTDEPYPNPAPAKEE